MSDGIKKDLKELSMVNQQIDEASRRGDQAKVQQLRGRLGPLLQRIRAASKSG